MRHDNVCNIIDDYTYLTRAFAVIGLMRRVKSATPIDLVVNYLEDTHSQGPRELIWQVIDANEPENSRNGDQIRESAMRGRSPMIPDGIYRMAKGYLINKFWQNIHYLMDSYHIRSNCHGSIEDRYRNQPISALRLYPKEVINTLGGLKINSNCDLWEARNAIANLHAVVTPVMLDTPSWMKTQKYGQQSNLMAIGPSQARNVSALWCVLNNYLWKHDGSKDIPNDAEKEILLNLIETFVIMFGGECDYSFSDLYKFRQTYEYARIGSFMSASPTKLGYGNGRGVYFGDETSCDGRAFVPARIETLQYMSPEAALCIGDMTEGGYSYYYDSARSETFKRINPVPINEVKVFLNVEYVAQLKKRNAARDFMERMREGRAPTRYGYDAPCEAPVPCCG